MSNGLFAKGDVDANGDEHKEIGAGREPFRQCEVIIIPNGTSPLKRQELIAHTQNRLKQQYDDIRFASTVQIAGTKAVRAKAKAHASGVKKKVIKTTNDLIKGYAKHTPANIEAINQTARPIIHQIQEAIDQTVNVITLGTQQRLGESMRVFSQRPTPIQPINPQDQGAYEQPPINPQDQGAYEQPPINPPTQPQDQNEIQETQQPAMSE
jgi:hypothetical protein